MVNYCSLLLLFTTLYCYDYYDYYYYSHYYCDCYYYYWHILLHFK